MSALGISIYPEHASIEENKKYIDQAGRLGFKRIFTCLLSVDSSKEVIVKEFKEMTDFAHKFGMEVIMDVAPSVFDRLGISYDDLRFFKEIGADGIRLDEGFDSLKEARMTHNPYGLKIEINASIPNRYLENIISYKANKDRLITCHNFYPQRYTGLSYKLFVENSQRIKDLNLKVAAFVSSNEDNTFGPWKVNEGLSTLEIHRDLPLDLQARHLFATGLVDDVIIANCFASKEELEALAKLDPSILNFRIEKEVDLTEVEEKIVFDHEHFVRGDMSDYMARSTMPRITYAKESIPAKNTRDLKRGDVVIINEKYDRYKGELHLVLEDMPNDGRKNVIGHLPKEEFLLLDYLEPWRVFSFIS